MTCTSQWVLGLVTGMGFGLALAMVFLVWRGVL